MYILSHISKRQPPTERTSHDSNKNINNNSKNKSSGRNRSSCSSNNNSNNNNLLEVETTIRSEDYNIVKKVDKHKSS